MGRGCLRSRFHLGGPLNSQELLSWGRYPKHPQTPHAVRWPAEVGEAAAAVLAMERGGTLAFGMGRSYGDSCMAESNHVVAMSRMDRVVHADWNTGFVTAQ